jgi:hypothetical protein
MRAKLLNLDRTGLDTSAETALNKARPSVAKARTAGAVDHLATPDGGLSSTLYRDRIVSQCSVSLLRPPS